MILFLNFRLLSNLTNELKNQISLVLSPGVLPASDSFILTLVSRQAKKIRHGRDGPKYVKPQPRTVTWQMVHEAATDPSKVLMTRYQAADDGSPSLRCRWLGGGFKVILDASLCGTYLYILVVDRRL